MILFPQYLQICCTMTKLFLFHSFCFLCAFTEFVDLCVKKILSLYKSSKHPPSSVILVGHSMVRYEI